MKLQIVSIEKIRFDPHNPRTDAADDLDELAASMQGGALIVQPPILIPFGDDYRILVGERRVRAAIAAGAKEIACLVQDDGINALDAHTMRVVENLHRKSLNPIDHAAALRVSWLLANARALGVEEAAEIILGNPETSVLAAIPKLEQLLLNAGFTPTAPARTWGSVLDELGVEMSADRRRKLLRVLSIPTDVQEKLQRVEITEAAVRSLGRLGEDQQREVADHLLVNPDLARSVRRIARAVDEQDYSVEEAVAEAEGRIVDDEHEDEEPFDALTFENDAVIADAVLRFLENANQLVGSLSVIRQEAPELMDIPDPWRAYYQQAEKMLKEELS